MMNLADDYGYEVEKNPVRSFHFTSESENQRTRVLTPEEEGKLMKEAASHVKPIIQIALQTGMRLQEILRMRVEDLDFEQEIITIRAENHKTGRMDLIPLPHSLKSLLKQLIIENGERTSYIFNYLDPRTNEFRPVKSIQHAFQAARRRAGIEALQFRDLRRTFGTRLHQRGVDPLIIQRLLRHSSFKISEQVYIQSGLKMMKEALNRTMELDKKVEMEHIWNTKKSSEKNTSVINLFSLN